MRLFNSITCPFIRFACLLLSAVVYAGLYSSQLAAQSQPRTQERSAVDVELKSEFSEIRRPEPDEQKSIQLAFTFTMEPGWHIYWRNSGEAGRSVQIDLNPPVGWQQVSARWPLPRIFHERARLRSYGYRDKVTLIREIQAESELAYQGEELEILAEVSWLACKDICVPGEKYLNLKIPFAQRDSSDPDTIRELAASRSSTPYPSLEVLKQRHPEFSGLQFNSYRTRDTLYLELTGLPGDLQTDKLQFFPLQGNVLSRSRAFLADGSSEKNILSLKYPEDSAVENGEDSIEGIFAFALSSEPERSTGRVFSFHVDLDSESVSVSRGLRPETGKESGFLVAEQSKGLAAPSGSPAAGSAPQAPTMGFATVGIALLSAFIGGLLLNLMPCVLPIISIKVLGFVCSAERERKQVKINAGYFVAGIVATFLILAGITISLRSLGMQLGWGFQFQHPEFVLSLTLIVFVLALGFFDFYQVALGRLNDPCRRVDAMRPSGAKHFFDGVLATILSTPCTAPFLGTAIVFAFSQSAIFIVAVYLAIALGLALPYFYLATHPKLLERLPRPGEWMNSVKHFMGFCLLATVVWLLFVLHQLVGIGSLWSVVLMLLLAFGLWLYDKLKRAHPTIALLSLALLFAPSLFWGFPFIIAQGSGTKGSAAQDMQGSAPQETQVGHIDSFWNSYSEEAVTAALEDGQTVFLNFTAAWCVTCKANDLFVLSGSGLRSEFRHRNVKAFKADWTDGNAGITEALNKYGAVGVPLYVVLQPGRDSVPKILPTILTTSIVSEAIGS